MPFSYPSTREPGGGRHRSHKLCDETRKLGAGTPHGTGPNARRAAGHPASRAPVLRGIGHRVQRTASSRRASTIPRIYPSVLREGTGPGRAGGEGGCHRRGSGPRVWSRAPSRRISSRTRNALADPAYSEADSGRRGGPGRRYRLSRGMPRGIPHRRTGEVSL